MNIKIPAYDQERSELSAQRDYCENERRFRNQEINESEVVVVGHKGCKHLDYETKYVDCEVITIEPEGVKYWQRNVVVAPDCPTRVQFCKERGRINDIFSCINAGERSCFEEQ